MTNGAPATAPRLVGVSRQLLLVSPARVALGLAALAAALVAGIEPSVALALFGLGAGGLAFVLFTDPRPRLRRLAGGPRDRRRRTRSTPRPARGWSRRSSRAPWVLLRSRSWRWPSTRV